MNLGFFSGVFNIEGERRRELWFVFFFSLLNILFLVLFIQIMDFYPIMDFECDITSMRGLEPTWGLKHENLRVRKPIGIMGKLL